MTDANVELTAGQLRRAVATGSHAEAAKLLEDYRRAIEASLHMLQPGDPATDRLRTDALQLIEWARRTTLAARTHYSRQLAALPDLRKYATPAVASSTYNVLV
jgi:hypothetical protein